MINKIVIISVIVLLMAGCHSHEEHHEVEARFLTTSPLRMDTVVTRDYVCQIKSVQHIELRVLEKGYVQNIYVDEGQSVKQGEMMFQIMPLEYKAELHKAKAETDFAEIEYLNTKSLADSNIVSANELALAKAKFEMAKAELELAEVHMGFTEIHAPFNGIMDRFNVRLGSLVDEGDLLTTLSDNSSVWVYFNVPEAEYLDYMMHHKQGSMENISLVLANNEIFDQKGKVSTIEADFDNKTGNIAFRATFPNPNGLLRHGETGNIRVSIDVKDALIIPQKATFEILDKKFVFVIDDSNIVRLRQIETGEELPHLYIITKGLEETDKILLEGIRKVRDKDSISIEYLQPDSALKHLQLYAE